MPIAGPAPISAAISATPGASVDNNPTKPSGFVGGVQAGYNWQSGPWVFGVEGDIQATGANDTFAPWKFSNPWFGTVRGRVGYAFNNILFYGTGGLAFGELRGETFGLSETHTKAGWTVGVGAEFGLTQNWSAKIEYLYVDLANSQLHHHRRVERLPVRTAARRRELSLLITETSRTKNRAILTSRPLPRPGFFLCCVCASQASRPHGASAGNRVRRRSA